MISGNIGISGKPDVKCTLLNLSNSSEQQLIKNNFDIKTFLSSSLDNSIFKSTEITIESEDKTKPTKYIQNQYYEDVSLSTIPIVDIENVFFGRKTKNLLNRNTMVLTGESAIKIVNDISINRGVDLELDKLFELKNIKSVEIIESHIPDNSFVNIIGHYERELFIVDFIGTHNECMNYVYNDVIKINEFGIFLAIILLSGALAFVGIDYMTYGSFSQTSKKCIKSCSPSY
jgi:hypothetical protein